VKRFYEKFYKRELVEVPSPFPPPWDIPSWEDGDGTEIDGVYLIEDSTEVRIAAAQGVRTRGRFCCHPGVSLQNGDTVRRVSDNVFIRLTGDPKRSPAKAKAQIQTFEAEIISRGEQFDIADSNIQHGEAL